MPAPGTVPPPAGTLGTVPPAKPAANCAPPWAKALTGAGALRLIDYCRGQQGIGPLRLPSNFAQLSVPEQMLVIIDLERVNRGEVPVAGLTAPLDHLAQQAAATGSDPAIGFGDIWEGGPISTAQADYGWMYDDGYAGSNTGCTAPGSAECWGHRDIILADDVPGAAGGRRRFPDRPLVRQLLRSRPGRLCPGLEAGVQLGRRAAVLPRPARRSSLSSPVTPARPSSLQP